MTWIAIILLAGALVCFGMLLVHLLGLWPKDDDSGRLEKIAWFSLGLISLTSAWALFQSLTFSLGSSATTGGSLLRWGATLFGVLVCWYVARTLQKNSLRGK